MANCAISTSFQTQIGQVAKNLISLLAYDVFMFIDSIYCPGHFMCKSSVDLFIFKKQIISMSIYASIPVFPMPSNTSLAKNLANHVKIFKTSL